MESSTKLKLWHVSWVLTRVLSIVCLAASVGITLIGIYAVVCIIHNHYGGDIQLQGDFTWTFIAPLMCFIAYAIFKVLHDWVEEIYINEWVRVNVPIDEG